MNERSRDVRRSAEYTAKTVGDALQKAAQEFGVSIRDLKYEVLKDSSHTIFGLVRTGEVIVRVWLPTAPREMPPPQAQEEGYAAPIEAGAAEEAAPVEVATEEAVAEEAEEAVAEEAEEQVKATHLALAEEEEQAPASGLQGNPPELETVASDVLSTLVDKMGLLAAVEVVSRGGKIDPETNEATPLVLNLVGDDLGVLIGRRGETLRDLQFITRLIISRKLGVWPNLIIDVENYKANRVQALQSLAKRMADQVRRTGRPVRLEPMPAYERRIIHLTLRDDPDVYTESTGTDEQRKVQIFPK